MVTSIWAKRGKVCEWPQGKPLPEEGNLRRHKCKLNLPERHMSLCNTVNANQVCTGVGGVNSKEWQSTKHTVS